jgi:hypothetical protein
LLGNQAQWTGDTNNTKAALEWIFVLFFDAQLRAHAFNREGRAAPRGCDRQRGTCAHLRPKVIGALLRHCLFEDGQYLACELFKEEWAEGCEFERDRYWGLPRSDGSQACRRPP